MKKLLLSLSFMTLAFANIKAIGHSTINETIASEQTVFTENNDQLILENSFGEQQIKDKAFLDLSIKEIWNTKLKPLLVLALLISSFTIVQGCMLLNISKKMSDHNDFSYCFDPSHRSRSALDSSFELSLLFTVLAFANIVW